VPGQQAVAGAEGKASPTLKIHAAERRERWRLTVLLPPFDAETALSTP